MAPPKIGAGKMFLFLQQIASYPICVSCLLHAPCCVHSKTDLFWETIEQKISVGLCISLSTDIEDNCLQLVLLFKAWAWTGEAMFVRPIFLHKMVLETGPQNHVVFHMFCSPRTLHIWRRANSELQLNRFLAAT